MVADMIAKGELDPAEAAARHRSAASAKARKSLHPFCGCPGASFIVGVALPVDGGYTAQ